MKTFKLKKLAKALALTGLAGGFASQASAAPQCPENLDPQADYRCMVIDVGTNFDATDADSRTGGFYELGLTGSLATSIYTAGLGMGSAVYDTNIESVLNSFGIVGNTTAAGVGGPDVNIKASALFAERNIDTFNPLANVTPDTEGYLVNWDLTFDYYLEGTLTGTGAAFDGGYFNFFYSEDNGVTETQVLRVNIGGSTLDPANLALYGTVSFDFDNDGDTDEVDGNSFLEDFWNFQTGTPSNWYELAGTGMEIDWAMDTNVNPPFPTLNSLREFSVGPNDYWVRQTTLDSSIRVSVPEPASLALMGLGLIGIGATMRKRRKSA